MGRSETGERHGAYGQIVKKLTVVVLAAVLWSGCSQRSRIEQQQDSQTTWIQLRADIRYRLATQQYAAGLTAEAIVTVEEAINVAPDRVDYYVLLARACLEDGRVSRARGVIKFAAEIAPNSAEVAYTHGTIEERCQQPAKALLRFERANQLDPTQVDFLVAQAECLVALDRPHEAYELVARRIHDFDRDGTLEALLGSISLLLGRYEEAAASFRIALDMVGQHDALAEQYGLLLVRLERHAEAIGILKPLVDSQGDATAGSIVRTLATCYLATGQAKEAETVMQNHLGRHSDDAQAWMLLAKCAILSERLDTARLCVDHVVRLAPEHPQTHLIRGYVFSRENRLHDARRSYERALALAPSDVLVHCLLGDVFSRLKETSRARTHYSRALQIDAQCRWARRALSELDASALYDPGPEKQFSQLNP